LKAKSELDLPYLTPKSQSLKHPSTRKPVKPILLNSASETKAGHNAGAEKPNQDYMLHKDYDTAFGTAHLRLVADGHGVNGHLVAQMVALKMADEVFKFLQEFQDDQPAPYAEFVKEALAGMFARVDAAVLGCGVDVKNSGSTLTVALVWQNVLAIAYVGDSKAVLLSKIKNLINVAAETSLHHPEEPTERKRIQEAGGVVSPIRTKDGDFEGPMRVWKPDMTGPGLAVARSFGDSHGKLVGVNCKPGTAS
jgi:serine/threonine protein phosphatase PrpC